jgi:hypothetical protein
MTNLGCVFDTRGMVGVVAFAVQEFSKRAATHRYPRLTAKYFSSRIRR